MPRKSNVVYLMQEEFKVRTRQWADTPLRKLARERNWCWYILAGMEALSGHLKRFGLSDPVYRSLLRAIQSARYGVDAAYYERREAIEAKQAKRKTR